VVGIVVRHHRIEPQPPRVLRRDRCADNARGVADDEGHLFRGAERGRDDQIALAFAVIVIGDDDEFAPGEGLQDFLNRVGHFLKTRFLVPGWITRTLPSAPASIRRAVCRPRGPEERYFMWGGHRGMKGSMRVRASAPCYGRTSLRSARRVSISARLSSRS